MSEKINYEEMIELIWEQREIEFVNENQEYAFLTHKEDLVFVDEIKFKDLSLQILSRW
jgi:uncharacterized pyridoxamine 5'-phosphate oxidase family protein